MYTVVYIFLNKKKIFLQLHSVMLKQKYVICFKEMIIIDDSLVYVTTRS